MNSGRNQYQYDDLREKSNDLYASAKYGIIKGILAQQGAMRILNAGCGSGELSFLLARDGHTVHGIDPSEEYIALARNHGAVRGASFETNSIESFSTGELFDAVVATDVLEHIKDDYRALKKLVQFVRPAGLIIITVPALPWLYGYHDRMLGHFRRYTKATLGALLHSAGLRVQKIRYFGFTLMPVSMLYSKFLEKPYPVFPKSAGAAAGLRQAILRLLLALDRHIPAPFGTSVIGICLKR